LNTLRHFLYGLETFLQTLFFFLKFWHAMLQQILLIQKQFLYSTSDEKQWELNFIHNMYGFSINAGQADSNKMLISY
jgi:hypothetical protein